MKVFRADLWQPASDSFLAPLQQSSFAGSPVWAEFAPPTEGPLDELSFQGATIPGSGPPPYATGTNVGDSSAYGAELSLTGKFEDNWRWGVNYRFESIADRFLPVAAGGTLFIDFQHVTPRHVAKANLGWASGRWEIDSYFNYQSPTSGLNSTFGAASFLSPVPDYVSVDARIAYRLTDWATLAISGQDIGLASKTDCGRSEGRTHRVREPDGELLKTHSLP